MKNNVIISILMTAYNREKYIAAAIESVLYSTFKNFELIIVDDCSKDTTVEIATRYQTQDPRVKVYINEENIGDYPNRNKAASYATGSYIKYIDADDMIYPWGLEIIARNLNLFPNAGYFLDSIEQDCDRIFPIELTPTEAYNREYFISSIFNKAPTSATIKLEIFNKYHGFSGKQMVGDFEMWHKLSLKENVILLPHGIIWSRNHAEQESKLTQTDSIWLFKYMLISLHFLNLKETPMESKKKEMALNNLKKSMSRSILRSFILDMHFAKAIKKKKLANLSTLDIIYFGFKN